MKFQIFKIPLIKFSKLYEIFKNYTYEISNFQNSISKIFKIIHIKFQIFKIPLVKFSKLYI